MEDQQEDTRCQVEENLSKKEQWHHGLGVMPQVNMNTQNIFPIVLSIIYLLYFLLLDDTYYLSKTLFLIVSLPPRGIGEA